jgi:hypothetical protein
LNYSETCATFKGKGTIDEIGIGDFGAKDDD